MVAVSLHLLLRLSTDFFTRLRYLASCSSAEGTRFRHSATARSLALLPVVRILSCCFENFSFCADSVACQRSSLEGRARLSKMSKKVILSRGTSQSSWRD